MPGWVCNVDVRAKDPDLVRRELGRLVRRHKNEQDLKPIARSDSFRNVALGEAVTSAPDAQGCFESLENRALADVIGADQDGLGSERNRRFPQRAEVAERRRCELCHWKAPHLVRRRIGAR